MGIDVYTPKHQMPTSAQIVPQSQSKVGDTPTSPIAEVASSIPASESSIENQSNTNSGLAWLSGPGANGILILLPSDQCQLNDEAKQLMIKMIQAINVKAVDCGYLSTDNDNSEVKLDVSEIRGMIAFGKKSGDHMVHHCGARRVPGEHYFQIQEKPMIVTLHPEELIDTPELKRQAWNDLQLLDRLLNDEYVV